MWTEVLCFSFQCESQKSLIRRITQVWSTGSWPYEKSMGSSDASSPGSVNEARPTSRIPSDANYTSRW